MSPSRADMIVIGGGLIGLATALAAARAGLAVTLLEASHCGRFASSASAGGVRSLNRHPAEIPLARAALGLWRELPQWLGDDGGFAQTGQIRVAEDEEAFAALERRAAMVEELGYEHERLIGADELQARVGGLAAHCQGALVVDDDGFADPLRCVHAFRRAALAAGVTIREGERVRTLLREAGGLRLSTDRAAYSTGIAVNAAGAWGGTLAAAQGEPVPIRAAGLQMLVLERTPPFVDAVLGSEGRQLSLKQSAEGTVVIGGGFEGTVDAERGLSWLRPDRIAASLANAARLFPELRQRRLVRGWAGIEGMIEDGLPVIGPSRQLEGLIHAFGFSAHGFALAPLVGRIVTDLARGRQTGFDLAPFAIDRFADAQAATG